MSVQEFQGAVEFKSTVQMGDGVLESHRVGVEALTAAVTLKPEDSGKIFTLGTAGGFTVTLPAVTAAKGCVYTFIVKVAPTTAYIIAGGTADKMSGKVVCSAGGNEDEENDITGDQFNFIADTAVIGDKVEIICDGVGYYGYGITGLAGGITITG